MFKLILAISLIVSSESAFRMLVSDSMLISDCIDTSAQHLHDTFQELNATHDEKIYWIARITKKCIQHETLRDTTLRDTTRPHVDVPDYEYLVRLCGSDLECIFTFLKRMTESSSSRQ
jgi:hypothetical protein